jgi:hypothetical protein
MYHGHSGADVSSAALEFNHEGHEEHESTRIFFLIFFVYLRALRGKDLLCYRDGRATYIY